MGQDELVHVIGLATVQRGQHIAEANPRLAHHRCAYGQDHIWWHRWRRPTKVFHPENADSECTSNQSLLKRTAGRSDQTERRRLLLGGRTRNHQVASGSERASSSPDAEILLHLALDPTRPILTQHKEVWRVSDGDVPRIVLVAILNLIRLRAGRENSRTCGSWSMAE